MLNDYMVEKLPLGDCGYFTDRSQEIGMVEVIVPAESKLIGRSVLGAGPQRNGIDGAGVAARSRGREPGVSMRP